MGTLIDALMGLKLGLLQDKDGGITAVLASSVHQQHNATSSFRFESRKAS